MRRARLGVQLHAQLVSVTPGWVAKTPGAGMNVAAPGGDRLQFNFFNGSQLVPTRFS